MEQILPVIISSIIAFIGVIISIRESSKRSDSLVKAEIQKMKSEILQDYATKLLEKRTEVYPKLYSITVVWQILRSLIKNWPKMLAKSWVWAYSSTSPYPIREWQLYFMLLSATHPWPVLPNRA